MLSYLSRTRGGERSSGTGANCFTFWLKGVKHSAGQKGGWEVATSSFRFWAHQGSKVSAGMRGARGRDVPSSSRSPHSPPEGLSGQKPQYTLNLPLQQKITLCDALEVIDDVVPQKYWWWIDVFLFSPAVRLTNDSSNPAYESFWHQRRSNCGLYVLLKPFLLHQEPARLCNPSSQRLNTAKDPRRHALCVTG